MYHRYGRHGSTAWLRWYRRKYRRSRLPVVFNPAVVDIEITIHVERIPIVMALYEDENREELTTNPMNLHPVRSDTPYVLPEHLRSEVNQICDSGRIQGKIDARRDAKTRVDDLPSLQEIDEAATTEALNAIKLVMDKGLRVDDAAEEYLTNQYVKSYTAAYRKLMAELERSGEVPDERKRAIRQAARSDKDFYNVQNIHLQPEFVRYLAVARVFRENPLANRPTTNDLESIHEYVGSYCTFYQQYNPGEAGRSSRPEFL